MNRLTDRPVRSSRRRDRIAASAWMPTWPGWCLAALIIASDFQYRVRDGSEALSGSMDLKVVLELLTFGACGAYAVSRMRLVPSGRPRGPAVALVLFLTTVWLSVLSSPVPTYAFVRATQMTAIGVLAIVISRTATRADLHRMAHAVVSVALLGVTIGVVAPTSYPSALQAGRFTWLQLHPNAAANIVALAVTICFAYAVDRRLGEFRHPRLTPYVAIGLVLAGALVATGSRTSALGAIVACSVILVISRPPGRRVGVAMVAVPVLALGWLLVNETISSFAQRGQTSENLAELSGRTDLWERAVEEIQTSPVLGHGFQAARKIFESEEFSSVGGTHNALLEVMLDSGLVGAAAWLAVVGCVLFGALRLCSNRTRPARAGGRHADGPLLLGLSLYLIIHSLSSQELSSPATTASNTLIILLAWVLVIRRSPG